MFLVKGIYYNLFIEIIIYRMCCVMLVKVCGKDVYGFMDEYLVWINGEDIEVLYDEEE